MVFCNASPSLSTAFIAQACHGNGESVSRAPCSLQAPSGISALHCACSSSVAVVTLQMSLRFYMHVCPVFRFVFAPLVTLLTAKSFGRWWNSLVGAGGKHSSCAHWDKSDTKCLRFSCSRRYQVIQQRPLRWPVFNHPTSYRNISSQHTQLLAFLTSLGTFIYCTRIKSVDI